MLLAISVGVWAMIFMTALMRGMVDQMIADGIDALPGIVQIHDPDFRDDPSIDNSLAPPGPHCSRRWIRRRWRPGPGASRCRR